MIPLLSRHSVDRSPRAFHTSTHNVVRASCFEVVIASVESRKLFLDGSLCLAWRWPWSGCLGSSSWRQRSALLATFRRMWGVAIAASDYSTCIIQSDNNMPRMFGTAPRRAGKFSCRKAKRQCGCSYGSWMSSPSGVCKFPQKIISGVNFCFGVKSMLLETQRAVQCDSEIDRVWVVVKLQTTPCHIEFVFGISVP